MSPNYPFGIYIHVPWCRRRCVYCDFCFEVGKPDGRFSNQILQEWQSRIQEYAIRPAQSLYFGGGTPSLLSFETIGLLIQGFRESEALQPNAEITLGANPEDLPLGQMEKLKQAGVTRLSLGVQSLEPTILKQLGRKHTSLQAKEVIQQAVSVFDRVSVDVIVGVDGESLETIQHHLEWMREVGVGHISSYLLTLEEGAPLFKLVKQNKRQAPNDEMQAQAYEWIQNTLPALGFLQYEVSSFAVPGQESRHNRLYWSQGEYLGLGPGAHSMRLAKDGSVVRRHTQATWPIWSLDPLKAPFAEETLVSKEALLEALAFGIRDMKRGIDPLLLSQRHQTALSQGFWATIKNLEKDNYVISKDDKLFLTSFGARFADHVSRELLGLS